MRYYGRVAIALHWVLALALVGGFCLGFYMAELPISPRRLRLFNWHKWIGITILTLSLMRWLWRLTHRPPPAFGMPPWQHRMARAVHAVLYLLSLCVPIAGWAYSSAAGFPVVVFGVLALPDFVPVDKALAEAIKPWHQGLAWTMALLVLAHLGAALKHQFIDRDGLLSRMWFKPIQESNQHENLPAGPGLDLARDLGVPGAGPTKPDSGPK